MISENEGKNGANNNNDNNQQEDSEESDDKPEQSSMISKEITEKQECEPTTTELQDEPTSEKSYTEIDSNISVTTDDEENAKVNDFENRFSSPLNSQHAELPGYLLLGAIMIVILGVAFAANVSFINSLKSDVEILSEKVHILEEDNRLLKTKCDHSNADKMSHRSQSIPEMRIEESYEESVERPKTKTVWAGESEESIQILDKENQIPDYCYHDGSDDLFEEYNKEYCDRLFEEIDTLKSSVESKHKKNKKRRSNFGDASHSKERIQKAIDSIERDIKSKRSKKDDAFKHKKNTSEKYEKHGKKKNFKNKQEEDWVVQRAKQREQLRSSDKYDSDDTNWN